MQGSTSAMDQGVIEQVIFVHLANANAISSHHQSEHSSEYSGTWMRSCDN